MVFTFKLSRRLAVLRAFGILITSVTILSCQDDGSLDPLGPVSDSAIRIPSTKIRISPDSLMLEALQKTRFTALAVSSKGDTTTVAVDWTATGGSIASDGTYSSAVPGTFRVIGNRARKSWRLAAAADTAVVVVVPPQPSVVRIEVSPGTATVDPGDTHVFSAVGKLSDSTEVEVGVTWTATGGTIDAAGLYKAGTTPGSYRVIAANPAATLADTSIVTIPAPTAPTLARVILLPSSVSLQAGATQSFVAYGRTSAGDSIPVGVTFSATGGTITTVGLYTAGTSAGSYRVIARESTGTLADTSAVSVTTAPAPPPPPPTDHAGWQVTPNGSSTGQGTRDSPWSLTYALSGAGGRIVAGDTVWLRGGNYPGVLTSTLRGSSSAPIIVRQYPGERATLTGTLTINGSDTWYWGFEQGNANPNTQDVMGINVHAPRTKLISLTVHDNSGNGIGVWGDAANSEVVGSIIYNNGYCGSSGSLPNCGSFGHGLYSQSSNPNTQVFRQNVLFNQYGYGFHEYAEGGSLQGFTLSENVAFNSGVWTGQRPNILVGGSPAQADRVTVNNNSTYVDPQMATGGSKNFELGYGSQISGTATGNWVAGGDPATKTSRWQSFTFRDNRVYSPSGGSVAYADGPFGGWTWASNQWYSDPSSARWWKDGSYMTWAGWKSATGLGGSDQVPSSRPSNSWVRSFGNPYERGRGVIVAYNWDLGGSVSADLSWMPMGQAWEIRNAQAPFGPAVASGTGPGMVSLPMTGVTPPTPLRGTGGRTVPVTGPEFNSFIVIPQN